MKKKQDQIKTILSERKTLVIVLACLLFIISVRFGFDIGCRIWG
jgi:hypothetical protein